MKCPYCGHTESSVLTTRQSEDGTRIKRRRVCENCKGKFTTNETVETIPVFVVKKDGSRQAFDREKLLRGLLRACEKRPVERASLDKIIDEMEYGISSSFAKEISSVELGEMVLEKLKEIDQVAYVRFASVYHEFQDIDSFMKELKKIQKEEK